MENKKRKPLADITNTYSLRPISALRQLVADSTNRNSRFKPSVSPLNSVASSANTKRCPASSNRFVTHIGSSSNAKSRAALTINSGGLGNEDASSDGRQTAEKDKKEEKTNVPIDSLSHVEKRNDKRKADATLFSSSIPTMKADFLDTNPTTQNRKDKGKAVAEPFSSSMHVRKDDVLVSDPTPTEKRKDKGKAVALPFGSLVLGEDDVLILDPASAEKRKDKGNAVLFDSSVPWKKADDLTFNQTLVEKNKGKGKAVDVPCSSPLKENEADVWTSGSPILAEKNKDKGEAVTGSSMLEVMKDYQNILQRSYIPLKKRVQEHQLSLWPDDGGLVDMPDNFGKDVLRTYTWSCENAKIEKPVTNSASSMTRTVEVTEKSIANLLNSSSDGRNEISDGTDRSSTSSTVKRKEREKGKHLKFSSPVKETRDKGEELVDTVTMSRQPRRTKSDRGKYSAGAFSCPFPRKTTNKQNDHLDEVTIDKSWTDPRPISRKKIRKGSKSTDEAYEEFIKEHEEYIKQQQAYFKDIDEEELIVEEASQEDESD